MANRIPARVALLGLFALTAACAPDYYRVSAPGDEVPVAPAMTAAEPSEYGVPQAASTSPMRVASNRSYATEYDPSPVAIPIKPGAPERYTVVRGDTLWDISGLYLEDPWLWPEIWHVNPQIENPHLIYPGDVLTLVWIDGRPQIRMERDIVASADTRLSPQVRYQSLDEAITTIPYDVIASFLSKPTVIDRKTARDAPYIVGIRQSHLIAGSGFDVYVRGTDAPIGTRFRLYNIGDELFDPDTGRLLGYEGLYVGEGRITATGDPATMFLTETRREALQGDRLILEEPILPMNFFPRAPEQPVEGKIISVVDGVSLIGTYQIVSVNLGAEDGMQPGHVLSIFQVGDIVQDRYAQKGIIGRVFGSNKVQLPETHAGEVMLFRVADEISYGLIMHATSEINILDTVRDPI